MYAFAQRKDMKVVDEPFYGHYLQATGVAHPGREEVLAQMETDPATIEAQLHELDQKYPYVFLKNMAHHHVGLNWKYMQGMRTMFLIRDPARLIRSLIKVIPRPTMRDIGLDLENQLLEHALQHGPFDPLVIDTQELLSDPNTGLRELCQQLDIPFDAAMLKWKKGPIPEDGVWAKYWYRNVHNSTGLQAQQPMTIELEEQYRPLYQEALFYYERLKSFVN
jgi:hypothetical protein